MKSMVRLMHYFSGAMIVVPAILIILTGLDYLDKNVFHNSFAWIPFVGVLGAVSLWIFVSTDDK